MTEHIDKDTLKAELANALHCDWCGCDAWDGVACEDYHDGEFGEAANAALTVVLPKIEGPANPAASVVDGGPKDAEIQRLRAELDAALGGEARARQECNELYEEVALLKRELANAQQAYNRTFDRMATIENEELGR